MTAFIANAYVFFMIFGLPLVALFFAVKEMMEK